MKNRLHMNINTNVSLQKYMKIPVFSENQMNNLLWSLDLKNVSLINSNISL